MKPLKIWNKATWVAAAATAAISAFSVTKKIPWKKAEMDPRELKMCFNIKGRTLFCGIS